MSVPYKPDSVLFYQRSDNLQADKEATVPGFGSAVAVLGYMDSLVPATAFTAYGLEINKPWRFFCDIEDIDNISIGMQAEWDGKTFEVRTDPRENQLTGHVETILQEVLS